MKKIIILSSSPRRNGNTDTLSSKIAISLGKKGVETETVRLNDIQLRGCQSCYACKKQDNCILKDDGPELLDKIKSADAVVFATPVFMWDMTAQLKTLVDRFFTYMNMDYSSKLPADKKFCFVVSQGQADEAQFAARFDTIQKTLQFLGFGPTNSLIVGGCMDKDSIAKREGIDARLDELTAWLVN